VDNVRYFPESGHQAFIFPLVARQNKILSLKNKNARLKDSTQIQDETIKGSLLDMAQVWMKLAEQAERERPTKK
jgi:hypothetical protein